MINMALLPWQVTEYNVTLQPVLLMRVYVWKSGMGRHKESLLSTGLDQWFPTGVLRHPRVPFTMPRGAAS